MTDEEREEAVFPSPLAARPRSGSIPNDRASIALSHLERGWSTGNTGFFPYESFSTPSTRGSHSFAENWASGTFSTSIADFYRPANTSSFASLPSYHSSIRRASEVVAAPAGQSTEQMLKSLIDENAISSIIHDEARIEQWDRVLHLCKTQPQHAQYAGPDGWTALHHACSRRCDRVDLVEALLRAYPSALLDLNEKGMTPLHYACRFKAPREVVRLLLYLFPALGKLAVSKRDALGRTPFWYAFRYDAPKGVVEMLLEIDPSVVLEEDRTGESPLSLVWDSWAEKFEGKRTLAPFLQEDGKVKAKEQIQAEFHTLLKNNQRFKSRWETTNLFLKANFGMLDAQRKYRMLHATAAIACHPTLFRLASCLYPEQASELDECDLSGSRQTALHLAAASRASGEHGRAVITTLLQLYPDAVRIRDSKDGSLPLHKMVVHKAHWIHDGIRDVFLAYRDAVLTGDFEGRLPLHRAAAAHQRGGGTGGSIILQLIEVSPEAAAVTDLSGRMALHYIAEFGEKWEEEAEAVYRAHEAAIRCRAGEDQRLPIHMAAASPDARRSMLETLVELHPRGVRQADRMGKLPLHLACESGKMWTKGVGSIYEAYPDAIREPSSERRWVPIQMAAASPNASRDVISQLASLYPEGAQRVDADGKCALHLACDSGKEWDSGLGDILGAYPEANIIPDNGGRLPFHIAAIRLSETEQSDGEEEEVNELERKTFETRARSSVADLNPSAAVDTDASKVEVLFQLLMADPNILPIDD